jgi:hypothetical protein
VASVTGRAVVHTEEIAAAVDHAVELARRWAEELRAAHPEREYVLEAEKPDVTAALGDVLRAALEDEVVPATEVASKSEIVAWELDRELIKKALVGLKRDELKTIAASHHLDVRGDTEHLASVIARAYGWDEEAIARLVLEHESEPSPERGHVSRLIPLIAPPDVAGLIRRLEYVRGRYVRVAVARWFVFESIRVQGESVNLVGRVRAYQASVDERVEAPQLARSHREDEVRIRIDGKSSIVQVDGASTTIANSVMRALQATTDLKPINAVPLRQPTLEGSAMSFAGESLFLLDVLFNRLPAAGLSEPNLTVARFRLRDAPDETEDNDAARRPRLKAVRFEGDHLLDSVTACRLLAREARPLVDVSLRAAAGQDPTARYPIRMAIERNHVLLITGFGTRKPELSASVHAALRHELIAEIEEGIAKPQQLARLADRITERSRAEQPVEQADMLDAHDTT